MYVHIRLLLYRALLEHPECIDWALLPRALLGLVALLCGNGYIVGINQIYDVDIDVLNKPFLPVASGGGGGRPRGTSLRVQHQVDLCAQCGLPLLPQASGGAATFHSVLYGRR